VSDAGEPLPLGAACPDFRLPAVDGRTLGPADFADATAFGVFFICNHCPYVKAVESRLIALWSDYRERGFAFVGVSSNDAKAYPEDSFVNMKAIARDHRWPFPYLYDEDQGLARAFGAVCTPDPFVFGPDRRLAYHGRLDDSPKDPARVTRQELRLAVDAILAGRAPAKEQVPSIGCSIKWRH
jgi:peroxiredoxin